MARKPFMAGNWKMNLDHLEAIAHVQKVAFALNDEDFAAVEVGVMVPFTDIRSVQTLVDADSLKVVYGSQDISAHDKGAYTGEISGPMLAKLGCTYAVIGHSERRQYHAEDDALVNAKVRAAYRHGLIPIMCIGEVKEQREAGIQEQVTLGQLDGGLAGIPAEQAATIVIAYEPVWAIGTGLTATPQDAQDMCAAIRRRLAELYGAEVADAIRIQYGGSVKAANAAEIMAGEDVDGALIGGASLDADEFVAICKYRLA
ncbi:MAG: triose-phosphate isomerase [Candidatus Nanopelagicales bacterium]|jgi:triosephosphate isomerase|nr:triose-phosphate isomerase [Candidatus Nanopelagicales bacterium]